LGLRLEPVPTVPAAGGSGQEDRTSCRAVSLKGMLENEVWVDDFCSRVKLELELRERRVGGDVQILCIYLTEQEGKGK